MIRRCLVPQRRIVFEAKSLLNLLIHYTMDHDQEIPLDGELRHVGISPYMGRMIGLWVESDKWSTDGVPPNPDGTLPDLHIRFEGNRVMSWTQDGETPTIEGWRKEVESPQ